MPKYVTTEKKLYIQSAKQLELMVAALEAAYKKADLPDKKIYSRLLRMFEK